MIIIALSIYDTKVNQIKILATVYTSAIHKWQWFEKVAIHSGLVSKLL